MMRTLRAEIIFQQRTQTPGTETRWAGAARAETSLQFTEVPAHWRRGGPAPALPLFAEHPQAPRCCAAPPNPAPRAFGSYSALSSLASAPIYERSLPAQRSTQSHCGPQFLHGQQAAWRSLLHTGFSPFGFGARRHFWKSGHFSASGGMHG